MILLVCGLSQSGKSNLIERAQLEGLGIPSVKASTLLRTTGRPTVELDVIDAIANQDYLAKQVLQATGSNAELTILDGHLLIETIGGPQLVPDASLAPLPIVGVIFVQADSNVISKRREGSTFSRSIDEITDLAQIELSQARRFARKRGVLFEVVDAGDVKTFTQHITKFKPAN
ncbi:hypothetical protein NKH95_27605 [Mesorhizobium sp. M0848]|uniref:AAA family ATPase n=1 Tax=Mesorhizobium sp. M0848 TaxID=2957012 RepID=UPI003335EEB1